MLNSTVRLALRSGILVISAGARATVGYMHEARSARPPSRTLFVATALAVTGLAHANIVTNGGFETGDFSGWTQFGDVSFSGIDSGGQVPHTGNFGAYFGPDGQGGIFQTLATAPGASYRVSFFINQLSASTNTFEFNWDGGVAEWSYANINPGYTTLNFDLIATKNSTDLRFTFSNLPSFWAFDDVSVEAHAVPEPASLVLAGLGIAGLMAARRQREAARLTS